MHDLAFQGRVERLDERDAQHLHVLLVGFGTAFRLGEPFGEEEVRATGQKCSSMHYSKRPVSGRDQSGLFGQLASSTLQRLLAVVERAGGQLPRRCPPRMPPLAAAHPAAIT